MRKSTLTSVRDASTPKVRAAPAEIPLRFRPLYRKAADQLARGGKYVHETDEALLRHYILAIADLESARAQVAEEGMTVDGSHGLKPHPLLAQINSLRVTIGKLAMTLGLCPAARVRLSTSGATAAEAEQPGDPWAPKKPKAKPKTNGARLDG